MNSIRNAYDAPSSSVDPENVEKGLFRFFGSKAFAASWLTVALANVIWRVSQGRLQSTPQRVLLICGLICFAFVFAWIGRKVEFCFSGDISSQAIARLGGYFLIAVLSWSAVYSFVSAATIFFIVSPNLAMEALKFPGNLIPPFSIYLASIGQYVFPSFFLGAAFTWRHAHE